MCIITGTLAAIGATIASTLTSIGTGIAGAVGISVAAAGASAAGAGVITGTTAAVIGGVAVGGLVAGITGTALGAVGSYQAGQAQAASAEYQAKIARDNANIAMNNAAMERQAGLEEARRQRIATLQMIGKQKTSLAANGVDVAYGTSLDIIEDTSMMGELDAMMIEYDAEKKARNYEIQANNFQNDAILGDFQARNARTAGTINAISGGLKAVGQLANSFTSLGGGFGGLRSAGSGIRMSGGLAGDVITFA
jgi:hypothetical protein